MDIKTYQWIKGENIGDVVKSNGDTLLEGNIEFLIFTNGTRCNTALITEYLQEIPSDHIDDLILLPNEFKVVDPIKDVTKKKDLNKLPTNVVVSNLEKPMLPITSDSPLVALLSTSKKRKEKINIDVEISLPPTDLLKVVAASFDDGEKQIFDYLVNELASSQITIIRNQIAETIMATVFVKEPKTIKRKNERLQDS